MIGPDAIQSAPVIAKNIKMKSTCPNQ